MATLPYSSRLWKSLRKVECLPTWIDLVLIGLVGGMFVFPSLVTAINHDEDQYLAGVVLAWDRLIFRDFMHLQTPLQAWLFAPITAVVPDHVLIALRVANALMALLALVGTYFAQRCAGVGGRIALVTTLLLAACPAFRISATVVRNDMVPLPSRPSGSPCRYWQCSEGRRQLHRPLDCPSMLPQHVSDNQLGQLMPFTAYLGQLRPQLSFMPLPD